MDKRKSRERQTAKDHEPTRLQLTLKSFADASRIGLFLIAVVKLFSHD